MQKEAKPLSSAVSSLLIKRSDSKSTLIARWSLDPFRKVLTCAADGAAGGMPFFVSGPCIIKDVKIKNIMHTRTSLI